jgi:septum formation protein
MQKIILASTSPYRKKLLQQINLSFNCESPTVDEELLKKTNSVSLKDLPLFLAEKKAENIAINNPGAVVIGSDQMGFLGKTPLNKAGSRDKAIEQLLHLQGKSHILLTAVAVFYKGKKYSHVDSTTLHMRAWSKQQLTHYVDLENPVDCAGSYKFESLGVSLFEKIECADPTAIVGLPLMALCRILESLGVAVL